jgi:hypothetical protein
MLLVVRNWVGFIFSLVVAIAAFGVLYFVWLRRIDESDLIVSEVTALQND